MSAPTDRALVFALGEVSKLPARSSTKLAAKKALIEEALRAGPPPPPPSRGVSPAAPPVAGGPRADGLADGLADEPRRRGIGTPRGADGAATERSRRGANRAHGGAAGKAKSKALPTHPREIARAMETLLRLPTTEAPGGTPGGRDLSLDYQLVSESSS